MHPAPFAEEHMGRITLLRGRKDGDCGDGGIYVGHVSDDSDGGGGERRGSGSGGGIGSHGGEEGDVVNFDFIGPRGRCTVTESTHAILTHTNPHTHTHKSTYTHTHTHTHIHTHTHTHLHTQHIV
jgi:hypothetical protein